MSPAIPRMDAERYSSSPLDCESQERGSVVQRTERIPGKIDYLCSGRKLQASCAEIRRPGGLTVGSGVPEVMEDFWARFVTMYRNQCARALD
jgi:hypothetical protein